MIYNETVYTDLICQGIMLLIIIASTVTLLFIWSEPHIEHFEENKLNITHNLTHLMH